MAKMKWSRSRKKVPLIALLNHIDHKNACPLTWSLFLPACCVVSLQWGCRVYLTISSIKQSLKLDYLIQLTYREGIESITCNESPAIQQGPIVLPSWNKRRYMCLEVLWNHFTRWLISLTARKGEMFGWIKYLPTDNPRGTYSITGAAVKQGPRAAKLKRCYNLIRLRWWWLDGLTPGEEWAFSSCPSMYVVQIRQTAGGL